MMIYRYSHLAQHPPLGKFWTTVLFILMGIVLGLWAHEALRSAPAPTAKVPEAVAPTPLQSPEEIRDQARQAALLILNWADQECERLCAAELSNLDDFFAKAKKQTPALADDILGWSSKLSIVGDHIPWIGSDGAHKKFLEDAVQRHLFTQADLDKLLHSTAQNYLNSIKGVEGQVLVKIRKAVGELPGKVQIANMDLANLQDAFSQAMAKASVMASAELRDEAVRQTISLFAGEVLTRVAIRLGVSGGILGAGASSGTVTFGVGLVAGIVADQILATVWDLVFDPHGELVRHLDGQIDTLRNLIVEGDNGTNGLRQRLLQFARARAAVRRRVILELITANGDNP